MRPLAKLLLVLALSSTAMPAQASLGIARFTISGIVPVRCHAQIGNVRITDGEAVISVDERCNTEHRVSFFVDPSVSESRAMQFAYNGQPARQPGNAVHFDGLGFTDQVSELRISLPGKSRQEVREALNGLRFELNILS